MLDDAAAWLWCAVTVWPFRRRSTACARAVNMLTKTGHRSQFTIHRGRPHAGAHEHAAGGGRHPLRTLIEMEEINACAGRLRLIVVGADDVVDPARSGPASPISACRFSTSARPSATVARGKTQSLSPGFAGIPPQSLVRGRQHADAFRRREGRPRRRRQGAVGGVGRNPLGSVDSLNFQRPTANSQELNRPARDLQVGSDCPDVIRARIALTRPFPTR